MEYDQINKNNSISINNLINLEKDIKFYLEGSDFKNNYITYMLQSCSNKEKSLQFSYYDFKTNIYSHESYLNFMEIPLNYENISITLNLEENDVEPLFFYYFNNESTNMKLLNDFSEKSNNFKFDYYFRNSILFWKEPFNDIEYKNLTIYTYDHKEYYNLCNFTEEEKSKAIKIYNISNKTYSNNFTDLLIDNDYEFYILLEYDIESFPIQILTSVKRSDDYEEDDDKLKKILFIVIPCGIAFIIGIIILIYLCNKSKKNLDLNVDPLLSMTEMR